MDAAGGQYHRPNSEMMKLATLHWALRSFMWLIATCFPSGVRLKHVRGRGRAADRRVGTTARELITFLAIRFDYVLLLLARQGARGINRPEHRTTEGAV